MAGYILTLGSLSLTLEGAIFQVKFGDDLPRIDDPDQASASNTSAGGGNEITGSSFPPRQLWTIAKGFNGDEASGDKICELWRQYDHTRRQGGNPKITLEDTIQFWHDIGARTRALATGASEIATTSGVKYYAKYYAYFTREPVLSKGYGFVLQLREGEVFAA